MGSVAINVDECNSCHNGDESTMHVNGIVDIIFDSTFVGGTSSYDDTSGTPGEPGNGYFDCSNTYCHSNGTSVSTGTIPNNTSPVWGTAGPLACNACHSNPPNYPDDNPKQNSHAPHAALAYTCNQCHYTTTNDGSTISDTSTHVNKAFNVDDNGTLSYTFNVAGGTCSTSMCHGGVSPQWGVDTTGIHTCTKCHGTWGAGLNDYEWAPPRDTDGDTLASNEEVGAHQVHMQPTYTNQLHSGGNCEECHRVPSGVNDAGHIDTLRPAEVLQDSDQNYEKANLNSVVPNYNYTTNVCSVYCHGADMPRGTTDGCDTSPAWNDSGYLSGSPGDNDSCVTPGDCEQCHGMPPNISPHVSTWTLTGANSCDECHQHFNDGGTLNDASLHINGLVEGGDNCSDCHTNSNLSARHTVHTDPDTILSGKALSTSDYGNLTWWYTYTNTGGTPYMGCGYCHPTSDAAHRTGSNNLNFAYNDTGAAGTLKAKNDDPQNFTQTEGVSVTCSSTYCHSDGYSSDGTGNQGTYGYVTSPNWFVGQPSDTFVGDKCNDCHANQPTTSSHSLHAVGIHYKTLYTGTTNLMVTGSGDTNSHGNSAYSTTINCHLCHNSTVTMSANAENSICSACHSDTNTPATGNDNMVIDGSSTVHVNGTPNVVFANVTMKSKAQIRDNIATVTELSNNWTRDAVGYKAAGAFDQANSPLNAGSYSAGTCSSIVCHNGYDATWTDTAKSCDYCHKELTN
jgi:predicted CxxxxCH...CXXCH cytochrome family protein